MTLTRRIGMIFSALISAFCAWLMLWMGEVGFLLVLFLLGITLLLYGLRCLVFYFTMARFMVDGKRIFYLGAIALDFGIVTLSLSRNQSLFIALYLLGAHAFSGAVSILRALEARKLEAPDWKLKLPVGIVNIGFAAAALVFGLLLGNMRDLTWIYAAGLIYSALENLISAFRKTAIVYIP